MHGISLLVVLRRLVLIALLFFPQRFWVARGWRVADRIRSSAWRETARVLQVAAAVAVISVLVDAIFYRFLPDTVRASLSPLVQLWVFTSTFAYFCVKAVHGVEWVWSRVKGGSKDASVAGVENEDRREFFRDAVRIAGALPFVGAVYGYARERLRYEVVRTDVPVANLPAELDGFRIVQLSDIHIGDFMPPEELRRAITIANELRPHLAVITGDLLSRDGDPLEGCIRELSGLKTALGVWGCNGNHEIYAGAEDEAEALFRHYGMKLLRGEAKQLEWAKAKLNLIGVDYQREVPPNGERRSPQLEGVAQLVRRDMPNVLLSHNPNTFYRAAELGIELSLAGHTHGGQINLEIVNQGINPARFMTEFIAGRYERPMVDGAHTATLYVNRGLGTLGIPARLGSRPEISLLTLRRA